MLKLPVFIMGKRYEIPEGYTILKAFEYAGYKMVRGCGCRAGACGACATVYRIGNDPRLKVALACQTMIESDMVLSQIPFFPAQKKQYDLEKLADPVTELLNIYPELAKCLGCNACTKSCPQKISVLDYMAASLRGDFAAASQISFDCLMCGICASRCPAEIAQYNIAIYVRRVYGKFMVNKSQQLRDRTKEIQEGQYDAEIARLKTLSRAELKELYSQRDIVEKKY